ncbi:MAG: hypothetical protein KAH64_06350 [Nitrosomonadaceae bacterium]|nr:hypothetical protein [Nitrosomonadaceae bacterium]
MSKNNKKDKKAKQYHKVSYSSNDGIEILHGSGDTMDSAIKDFSMKVEEKYG